MRRPIWLVPIVASLLGCSQQPPLPPDQFYRIYTQTPTLNHNTPRYEGILVVRRFLADGLVSERSVVYGEGERDNPLKQYAYHFWTESPTRMLQELIVPYLRRGNVASQVITPEIRVDYTLELAGKVKRLEQIRGSTSRVVVELEFGLSQPLEGNLLWAQDYLVEIECEDDSIASAVDAFNEAVSRIYTQLVEDIWSS